MYFLSCRRRHTNCALVTGVETCALPISLLHAEPGPPYGEGLGHSVRVTHLGDLDIAVHDPGTIAVAGKRTATAVALFSLEGIERRTTMQQLGRESCRERVWQ